jgi:branched-chain amino acid transport system substrate-binding protein
MIRKVAVLLLLLLLPACGLVPPLVPPPVSGLREREETLFQEAEAAYRQQVYRQAYQRYVDYLMRYPQGRHVSQARLKEAELLGLQGDWQGSLRLYQALLAREPGADLALKARYGIGRAYFKLGQYPQATQVLDNLTANPDLPRSLWFSTQALLAETALKQGNVPQAFSRLRLAAPELPSGDQEWFEDLKTRLVETATTEELEHLATLYRDDPLSATLLLRLARLAQQAGRSEEAENWVNLLKERFPGSPEAAVGEGLTASARKAVAALLPLSGEYAQIGTRVKQGMELALWGTGVDLVFRDTHSDPGVAPQLVRELAQDPSLLAIVGPLTSGVAQITAEAAQAQGVPLIALSQKAGLTQLGGFIFQAFLTPRQQVRWLLIRTVGPLGLKRYGVLYPDSHYGRAFLQAFTEELAAQGGELTAQEAYVPGTRDFAPALAAMRGSTGAQGQESFPFEALFVPDDAGVVAAVAAQLGPLPEPGVQLLGTNLLHAPGLTPDQLQALDGALFPDAFFVGDPNPSVQHFVSAYRQKYGEDPDYLATQGYVVARILARLVESGKSVSRSSLPQQLLALQGFPELPWFRGFNREREEEGALYLLTLKDGQVQMAAAIKP